MSQELIKEIKVQLALKDKNKAWLADKLELSRPYTNEILSGVKPGKPQIEKMELILAELKAGMYDKED